MPTVPYQPFSTVAPASGGTPNYSVNTPLAAFGGETAKAMEGLGKTIEGAGDELFKRAMALQQLKNESEAREADSNYMISAGELHANFSALQGKAAVDAYPKYAQDLQDTRRNMRDSLSNDMSRKLFDAQSLSTMGRTIFNGAGHAATQNKLYSIGTTTAQMDIDAKTVEDNPGDDVLFQQKLERTRANAANVSAAKGYGEGSPLEQDLTLKATSKLWAQRITGLARQEPFKASQLLDERKTELTQDDYLKVDNTVRTQGRAVGSVNIANDVYNAGKGDDGKPAKPLAEMEAEARDKARAFDPKDPLLAQHAVSALHGIYNQDKYAARQEDIANQQTVADAISKGVRDERELRADPVVAAAIDALPKDKRLGIPGQINRYNAARDKADNESTYMRLWGLQHNDPEEFLNTDITKEHLSQQNMVHFMNAQQKLKGNPNADPRVSKAIGMIKGSMGAQLEALGIYNRTQANKDDYDQFTGALSSALDVWTETHGKPPGYQEITKDIAPQVIKQTTKPGLLWGTNLSDPFFKQKGPDFDKWSEETKADVVAKGGLEPTDKQLEQAYTRMQFIKLYSKPKVQDKAPSK